MAGKVSSSGRVDARQEWRPLACGIEGCGAVAIVVASRFLATHAGKCSELRGARQVPHVGLCARHFVHVRPGVALESIGWGDRLADVEVEEVEEPARKAGKRRAG